MRTSQRKEQVARPRYQHGSLFIRGKRSKVWVARWRDDLIKEDGSLHRRTANRRSRIGERSLESEINQGRHRARPIVTFEKFAKEHWQPGAMLALKPSSLRIYQFNLDKYVMPTLGAMRLCDVNRATIQHSLLSLKQKGYSTSTLHGIRVTVAKVLQTAVELS